MKIAIISFYKFMIIDDLNKLQTQLWSLTHNLPIRGTILLAPEGINLNLALPQHILEAFWGQAYRTILSCTHNSSHQAEEYKVTFSQIVPFQKLKIKIKSEIIKFNQPTCNPLSQTGKYVEPENWHTILNNHNIKTIDIRNHYEVSIGTFHNAINPNIQTFTELKSYLQSQNFPKNQAIAMFCTGGIRCEKATTYLMQQNYENVYQLKGGIINFLQKAPNPTQYWKGNCFTFDNRLSLDYQNCIYSN